MHCDAFLSAICGCNNRRLVPLWNRITSTFIHTRQVAANFGTRTRRCCLCYCSPYSWIIVAPLARMNLIKNDSNRFRNLLTLIQWFQSGASGEQIFRYWLEAVSNQDSTMRLTKIGYTYVNSFFIIILSTTYTSINAGNSGNFKADIVLFLLIFLVIFFID